MEKEGLKRSWIVKLKCVVTKEVVTGQCTQDEAYANPFDHAEDERETGQSDYEVVSVEPNE